MLNDSAEPKTGKNGKKYWTIVFSVEIHFGLTEFKARIKWMDKVSTIHHINYTSKHTDLNSFHFMSVRAKSNSKHNLAQIPFSIANYLVSGPAVIVYNERGHRIEDDDIDIYPEDDAQVQSSARSERERERERERDRERERERDRDRSEPASRARTPVDSYYASNGGGSRRTSSAFAEANRVERSASKGYSPSIAPSQRSTIRESRKGSDGEKTGSDSDRRRGKDRDRESERYKEEDRDRGFGSPSVAPSVRSRTSAYGAPPIETSYSNGGSGNEMLSAGWGPDHSTAPSRSPSIMQQPQSRATSIYGGGTPIPGDYPPSPQGPPKSVFDEHRQSQLWDAPAQSNNFDSPSDRPKSPYVDQPKSVFSQHQSWDQPESSHPPEQFERAKTPFSQEPFTTGRSASPFIERPKSGIESFYDKPKSAFGDARHSVFENDPPPPAMFGDSGPAADAGMSTSLFGNPPGPVFGEPPSTDSWGFSNPTTPAVELSVTPVSSSGKKGKRKGSSAATPAATTPAPPTPAVTTPIPTEPPALFGSNASPSFGDNKSPFGKATDNFYDEQSVIAAPATSSPALGGGGLWGSKAPSPFNKKDKPLSPLNPASDHFSNDIQPTTTGQDGFDWSFNDNHGSTNVAGDGWGNIDLHAPNSQNITQAPSPIPAVASVEVVASPVEEVKEATTPGKKKKKKGSGAVTPSKQVAEEEEARKAAEQAEQQRLAKEEADRVAAEEEEKLKKEIEELEKADRLAHEKAEQERLEKEIKEQKEAKEQKEKEEKEQKEKEEKEKKEKEEKEILEKEQAAASSIFGNTTVLTSGGLSSSLSLNPPSKPWLSADTGGGDDSWGTWGAPAKTKKKGSKVTSPLSATKPSVFGGGGGWGASFGSSLGEDLAKSGPAASPKPSPKQSPAELPSAIDSWNFGTSAPNLNFGFDSTKPASKVPSRAPSPTPVAEEALKTEEQTAEPVVNVVEGGDVAAGAVAAEAEPEDSGLVTTTSKKKKKKKNGAAEAAAETETPKVETPAVEETPPVPPPEPETPAVEEPPSAVDPEPAPAASEPAAGASGGGAKKKKKKK